MNLGEWRPDQPPHGHDGLVVARNVFPSALGYEPVKDYSSITTALASTWKGGMTFIGVDGSVALLAGTDAGLYRFASGAWTLKHSGSYTNAWQFALFGDIAIGVNGAVPVKYTTARATPAELGRTPPPGPFIPPVKAFVHRKRTRLNPRPSFPPPTPPPP